VNFPHFYKSDILITKNELKVIVNWSQMIGFGIFG